MAADSSDTLTSRRWIGCEAEGFKRKEDGNPSAQNAIGKSAHRVIGKDGSLTGYGGGLWRKRLLLELERTGRLPGR